MKLPRLFSRSSTAIARVEPVVRATLENPATKVTPERLVEIMEVGSASEAGVHVTGESALRLAAVFTCVRIIAQTIATLPREVIEIEEDGDRKLAKLPISRALTIEPNEYLSAYDFFVMLQAHAELWGNAYAAIERNGAGQAVNLLPLISRNVAPIRIKARLYYDVTLMDTHETIRLPASEVIHVRGLTLDGLAGASPVALGKNAIGLTAASENYGARFFKNDARPSVVLKHEKNLSQAAAERLKANWVDRYGGTGQHMPAVLEEGLDFAEIGIAPEQAQFLETRKFQRQEIAALFGVPLSMLADPDAQMYRSGEWDDLRFTKHSILPRVTAWESELNRKLFTRDSKYRVRFDLRELERGAFKEQIEGLAKAVQNALMTPNEARVRLGLPKMKGGDALFLQQNMAGVEAVQNGTAGNKVANAAADGDPGDDQDEIDDEADDEEDENAAPPAKDKGKSKK